MLNQNRVSPAPKKKEEKKGPVGVEESGQSWKTRVLGYWTAVSRAVARLHSTNWTHCRKHLSPKTAQRVPALTERFVPLNSHAYCHSHSSHHTAMHTVIHTRSIIQPYILSLTLIPSYSHAYCHTRSTMHSCLSHYTAMRTVTHAHPIIQTCILSHTLIPSYTHAYPIIQLRVLSLTLIPSYSHVYCHSHSCSSHYTAMHIFTHSLVGVHTLTIPTRSPSRFESYIIRHPHIIIRQGGATLSHSDINA